MRSFALFAKNISHQHQKTLLFLLENAPSCWIHAGLAAELQALGLSFSNAVFSEVYELPKEVSIMICLGGDGTVLDAVRLAHDKNIAILGINTGRLGFLANVNPEDLPEALQKIAQERYTIQERILLHADGLPDNSFPYALNDITFQKRDSASMIVLKVWANGIFLNDYWADGLIFSTPTGSTAYSLSCGGPIMTPDTNNLVITPLAPHNLSARPLVLSADTELKIAITGRTEQFMVSLDHYTQFLDASRVITLKKAPFRAQMLVLEGENFYQTLRGKLNWGKDNRQ
jgi:NAD+ kinase